MRITKKINNNVAIGLDSKGKELIIFGKGIGFHEVPYELKDLSLITKTYYDIDAKYIGLVAEIPENIISVSSEIVDYARNKVNCKLSPSLAFTLADHINFAIERLEKSIELNNPLTNDIKHLYKVEVEIGYKALDFIERNLQIRFPSSEATSIALHIINAEGGFNDMNETIKVTKVIKEITKIVEEYFNFSIDQESLNYSRFIIHLRYFMQRIQQPEEQTSYESKLLFDSLKAQYPDTYICFRKIDDYFKNTLKWNYNEEEQLYLMVHINRLCAKKDCYRKGITQNI